MSNRAFIQANECQLIAAKVAKFALETTGRAREHGISVAIMNVNEMEPFNAFNGATYRCEDRILTFDVEAPQSFSLSRFMPPELMNYSGKALVIDPDVLALADVGELFADDTLTPVGACQQPLGWQSSVMMLDCSKLRHWSIAGVMSDLRDRGANYVDWMLLRKEPAVARLPQAWNVHDRLDDGTKMLHMTRPQTQPWRTGLPRVPIHGHDKPVLGIVPRARLRRLLGRTQFHEQHPERPVEAAFMGFLRDAISNAAVTTAEINAAIRQGHVRADIWRCLGD